MPVGQVASVTPSTRLHPSGTANVADTAVAAVIDDTVQVLLVVLVHPVQLANTDPPVPVAVRVTLLP